MHRKILSFIIFPILVVNGLSQDLKPLTNWEQMISDAKKSNKHIYIHCSYKECMWCYKMEKETYTDDSVKKLLEKDYVTYKILREDSLWPYIRIKYRVRAFPTFLILSPDGKLIAKSTGYMKPGRFIEYFSDIDFKNNNHDFIGISDTLNIPVPGFLKRSGDYYNMLSENQRMELCAFWDSQDDKFSESCWSILFFYNLGDSYEKFFLDNFDKYAWLYSYEDAEDKLIGIISGIFYSALKRNDSSKLDAIDTLIDKYFRKYREQNKLFYRMHFADENNDNSFLHQGLVSIVSDSDWKKVFNSHDIYNWTSKICSQMDTIPDVEKMIVFYKERLKNDNVFECNYTYSYLLYKTGMIEDARTYANKAMSMISPTDTREYTDIRNLMDKLNNDGSKAEKK